MVGIAVVVCGVRRDDDGEGRVKAEEGAAVPEVVASMVEVTPVMPEIAAMVTRVATEGASAVPGPVTVVVAEAAGYGASRRETDR